MSSSSGYRQHAPYPVATGSGMLGTDEDYDYSAASKEEKASQANHRQSRLPPMVPSKSPSKTPSKPETAGRAIADDPLHDLEQLEELHEEAERMKALGNKHMAAQVRRSLSCSCSCFKTKLTSSFRNIHVPTMHTRLLCNYPL